MVIENDYRLMPGRPEDVTDEDILSVILNKDLPAFFTGDVSDELPIKRNGTLKRLNDLHDRGMVHKGKRGRCVMWWITEKGGNRSITNPDLSAYRDWK